MTTELSFTRGQSLKTIPFDTATRQATFSADLTNSPQERGGLTTDGWTNKPDALSLNCTLTDTPLSRPGGGTGATAEVVRAARLLNELIEVKAAGLLCAVSTPWRQYDSMRIQTIVVNDDKPKSGARAFTITLQQSVVADSITVPQVTASERKPQPSTDKGKKGTDDADANKGKQSYIQKIRKGISGGIKQLIPESFMK
jgi:hypothetical protein